MRLRNFAVLLLTLTILSVFAPPMARADNLELKDGRSVEGIVKKIEKGQVTVEIGGETKVFDVLEITGIDFDSPHMTTGTDRLPLEHFLSDMEAKELVDHVQAVEKSAAEVRQMVDTATDRWRDRKTIPASQVPLWEAEKERIRGPLLRYQETLDDLYFHVLGKVDGYNTLAKRGNQLRVGVEGAFNVGSSLIPKDMRQLSLKKYVPGGWYDTIFFEGYDVGYNDAVEKYRKGSDSTE